MRRTRYRRMPNRKLLSSPAISENPRTIWPTAGCAGPKKWCQYQSATAESTQPKPQGRVPVPWACLDWRRGWLSSSRRDRCLRSVGLRRWVSGSRRGRWRGWWRCRVFFIGCWRICWVCRWRGRGWLRAPGSGVCEIPYINQIIIILSVHSIISVIIISLTAIRSNCYRTQHNFIELEIPILHHYAYRT